MSVDTSHAYLASMPYSQSVYPNGAPAGDGTNAPGDGNGPGDGSDPNLNAGPVNGGQRTGLDDYIRLASNASNAGQQYGSYSNAASVYAPAPAAIADSTGNPTSVAVTDYGVVPNAQTADAAKKKTSLAAAFPGLVGATAVTAAGLGSAVLAGILLSRKPAAPAAKTGAPKLPPYLAPLSDTHITKLTKAMSEDDPERLKFYSPQEYGMFKKPEHMRIQMENMRAMNLPPSLPPSGIVRQYAAVHDGKAVGYIAMKPSGTSFPNLSYWFTDADKSPRPKGFATKSVAGALNDLFHTCPDLTGVDAVSLAANDRSKKVINGLKEHHNFSVSEYKRNARPAWAIEQEKTMAQSGNPAEHVAYHISRIPAR